MQFGPDGLLSSISYPATPGINVSLGYDAYDRLASATDGAGSHSMSYDDLDELLSDTTTYTGVPAKTLSYTHYPDGSRNTMTTPGGTIAYSYYADGLYNAMNSPAGTSSAGYLDNGWENSRGLPNGALTFYGYNECGMLTSLVNQTSGGTTLSSYGSFSYDGVLNMLGMSANVPGQLSQSGATSWGYDTKDRLLSEASGRSSGTKSFVYDASGNPTTMRSVAGLGYDSDNRRTGNTYDGNGNPTTYNGTSCTFDAENRMTGYGSALSATYRFDGLRAKKSTSSGTQYFLYDGDQPVIEMDSSGTVTRMNIFAPDGLVASGTSSAWIYHTPGPQGSVARRPNSSQASPPHQ